MMALEPFPGFRPFPAHHCVTGSMRHVYDLHGVDVSEELLLGLGAGGGFLYWHQTGAPPMLLGRANVGRPGEEGMERAAGRRTGVTVDAHTTSSARMAETALVAQLEAGEPAMLKVDMAYLPYLDLPQGYHFGGHVVTVVGYDPVDRAVLVCDRDVALHPVPLGALARARGSTFKPFPPHHGWYTFDFRDGHRPAVAEPRAAPAAGSSATCTAAFWRRRRPSPATRRCADWGSSCTPSATGGRTWRSCCGRPRRTRSRPSRSPRPARRWRRSRGARRPCGGGCSAAARRASPSGSTTIVQPAAKQRTRRTRTPAGHELLHTAVPSTHGRKASHTPTSTSSGRSRIALHSSPRPSANSSTKNAAHMRIIHRNQSVAPSGRCRRNEVVGGMISVMTAHLDSRRR